MPKMDTQIPDGSRWVIQQMGSIKIVKAVWIDTEHLKFGSAIYHVSAMLRMLKCPEFTIFPEKMTEKKEGCWVFDSEHPKYLFLQSCDTGWDYTIYYGNMNELDGGQIDAPELKIEAIRNQIADAEIFTEIENFEE